MGLSPTIPVGTPSTFPSSGGGGFGSLGSIFGGSTSGILGNVGILGLGVLSSILNRPKSAKLSKEQKALLAQIQALIGRPVGPDPLELSGLLHNVAGIGEGARTRATKNIVGRGLGQSGILGQALSDIDVNLLPQLQFESRLQAQSNAEARKNNQISQLMGLFSGLPLNTGGQSAAGAGIGGLAQMLAFLLALNKK